MHESRVVRANLEVQPIIELILEVRLAADLIQAQHPAPKLPRSWA
jgi:hypothetical protein